MKRNGLTTDKEAVEAGPESYHYLDELLDSGKQLIAFRHGSILNRTWLPISLVCCVDVAPRRPKIYGSSLLTWHNIKYRRHKIIFALPLVTVRILPGWFSTLTDKKSQAEGHTTRYFVGFGLATCTLGVCLCQKSLELPMFYT